MTDPARGEVWLVDLGMAAKVRPALVISVPPADADRALFTIMPHTTATRESHFECALAVRFLRPGAFDAQGLATVPRVRFIRRLGVLTADQMMQIETTVARWLGLE